MGTAHSTPIGAHTAAHRHPNRLPCQLVTAMYSHPCDVLANISQTHANLQSVVREICVIESCITQLCSAARENADH
jgi:hypothetical protein